MGENEMSMELKEQLQLAFLNDRPRLFENLVDDIIETTNKRIFDLTLQNIFEIVIVVENKDNSTNTLSTLSEEMQKLSYVIDLDTESLLGYYPSDIVNSLYDYYEDQGFYLYNNSIQYFKMSWEDIIKSRTEPFTEKEIVRKDLCELYKSKGIEYKKYVKDFISQINSHIFNATKEHNLAMNVAFILNSNHFECTNVDYSFIVDEKRLNGYDIKTLVLDILFHFSSIGFNVYLSESLEVLDENADPKTIKYGLIFNWEDLIKDAIN